MGIQFGKAKLSTGDRIDFFKTLSGWLNSGEGRMSLSEAVDNTTAGFSAEEYAALAPQMQLIAREVSGGQTTLYQALAMVEIGFTIQELAIVEAAERSSQLRQALPSLVAAMEVQHQGKRELWMKMAGPLLIGVLLILLSIGVLVFMLPLVISPVISRNPKAVDSFPIILQWFWALSVWLRAHPYPLPGAITALGIMFLCRNTPFLQPTWLKFTLSWSVSRKLIIGFNSMVVAYFMPALVRSGMPTPQVLEQLAYCVTNPVLRSILLSAATEHMNGIRMSSALEIMPFKASFVNAITAGEATGALAERVEDLQVPYRIELERNIRQVAGTLKFIVMVILMPMFIISTYTALVGPVFALMEYGR
jgi:type II secretory pathway component PulF